MYFSSNIFLRYHSTGFWFLSFHWVSSCQVMKMKRLFLLSIWLWFSKFCYDKPRYDFLVYILLDVFQHRSTYTSSHSTASFINFSNSWPLFIQILPLPHFLSPSRTLDNIHISMCLSCFLFHKFKLDSFHWIQSSVASNLSKNYYFWPKIKIL